jgi:ribosomal peptide maturation radical SAM protein 1
MPFSGANRPQIALGLLQSALQNEGIICDVAYLNLVLADRLGGARYQWFSGELPDLALGGEWVFAHHFFGDVLLDGNGYLRYLADTGRADQATIDLILEVHSLIPEYLDHCLDSVDWQRYSIIGFTSTFEQNMASLSMAHLVKQRYPDKIIVFGGSNCGPPMGDAILRCFPFVDYVFTGESDFSFPAFVKRLGQRQPISDLKGIVYRNGGTVESTGFADAIHELDKLPFPNYDDYFVQLEATSLRQELTPLVPFETARGCWWGAKQHCTFCGLNALTMSFRAKNQDRALNEIIHLSERYGVKELAAVDNIIDMKYFQGLLPELKKRQLNLSLFYETKSNLTKEQVKLLGEAGIRTIQPGIESFNHRLLKLLKKGVSPLQNIQLLKWCREFDIEPVWNLLYGIPGERAADYAEMLPLLQSITHLQPPLSKGSIRLDRYSPYFEYPDVFGLVNLRPAQVYSYLYPFPKSELADIAYYYEFSFGDNFETNRYLDEILQHLEDWSTVAGRNGQLRAVPSEQELIIEDSRQPGGGPPVKLSPWQSSLYEFCDQVRSLKMISAWLSRNYPDISASELEGFLTRLVDSKLMVKDQDQYLSLAIIASASA